METEYKVYRCRKCGHEVMAQERPAPVRWDDGHVCRFVTVVTNPRQEG